VKHETSAWRERLGSAYRRLSQLPPGIRSLTGVALVVGGLAGAMLPVLGVWLVPIGLVLIALDIPPWRRAVGRWIEARLRDAEPGGDD